ncbi:hypothetical protein ACFS7Z_16350 [Pontibacter toksunensis]|uniref:EF-hand domain-containing protein n=1 Tax=Pontibacter toksunensis TaxID=1332631 RepID=A0ABW6BX53_9BACT
MEAEDGQQNVTKSSFAVTVHAPELDFASFSTIISNGAFFGQIDNNNDAFLNYNELGAAFYGSVNSGIEDWEIEPDEDDWNWFVQFHGLENQTWSDWDTNGDDILQPKEFSKGLEKASFLAEWDIDNDGLLSEEEFTSYLFSRLDHDGNGVLSSNEYVHIFQSEYWL